MKRIIVIALVWMMTLFIQPAQAEQKKMNYWPYRERDLSVSSEYFLWKEYLKDGSELLTESGVRWGFGLLEHNYGRRLTGVVYEVDMRFYTGTVAYDGKSQDGNGNFNSVQTKTDYLGGRMLVMAGQRLTNPSLDLLAGLEVNGWIRSLIGATDSAGLYASGYRELYRIASGRLGFGTLQDIGDRPVYGQIGVKYPLDIFEFATIDTVTLTPGPAPSLFASLTFMKFARDSFVKGSLKIFYDSYRFTASPSKEVTVSSIKTSVYQPESRMDVVGVTLQF